MHPYASLPHLPTDRLLDRPVLHAAHCPLCCLLLLLLLQIKTEVGIQTFRDTRTLLADAEAVLADLFQGDNTPQGYSRYRLAGMSVVKGPSFHNSLPYPTPVNLDIFPKPHP